MRAKPLLALAFLLAMAPACRTEAEATQTSAGVAVTNTATLSYTDPSGAFTAQSNTLTSYVQNAPAMTITQPTGISVTPAYAGVDSFTLTNTGNGAGVIALTSDATFGSYATLKGYILAGTACTATLPLYCSTYSLLNSAIATTTSSITVGVAYQVNTSATAGEFVAPSITANITYAAASNTSAATSSNVTSSTYNDTVVTDARLDVQTTAVLSGGAVNWSVYANNGGSEAAQGLASVNAALDLSGSNGIALFMPVPSFPAGTYMTVSAPATAVAGAAGTTATWYFNVNPCSNAPILSWTTYVANAECMAVFVSNPNPAIVLPSLPNNSAGMGSVGTPQITATFTTTQPAGNGSGTLGSVSLLASSAIGGYPWGTASATIPILGQPLAVGFVQDAPGGAASLGTIESNTASSIAENAPGGASNRAQSNASVSYAVLNGPVHLPAATGSYPAGGGTASPTDGLDFTAVGFDCANNNGAALSGGVANCRVPLNIQIPNTVQNAGNLTDVITLTATPPSGWTAQIFTASCSTPVTTVESASCGNLVLNSGVSTAGTPVSGLGISLTSGTSQDYVVQYNDASMATPFTGVDAVVTATGSTGDTNDTHNDIYPGGVISIVTSSTTTISNCPSGVATTTVCPGGTLKYVTTYANVAPAGSVMTNRGTEPSFAYAALLASSAGLTITSDGTISNGWAASTFGLDGGLAVGSTATAPVASDALVTLTCQGVACSPGDLASGTYPTMSTGANLITATIPQVALSLAPGGSGTITYYVTVR